MSNKTLKFNFFSEYPIFNLNDACIGRKNNITEFHEISVMNPEEIIKIFQEMATKIIERILSDQKNIKLIPAYALTTYHRCW